MRKYTLERDVEELGVDGKCVLLATQAQKGHIILWFDKKGYTNSVREYGPPEATSIGNALSFEEGLQEYKERIDCLI